VATSESKHHTCFPQACCFGAGYVFLGSSVSSRDAPIPQGQGKRQTVLPHACGPRVLLSKIGKKPKSERTNRWNAEAKQSFYDHLHDRHGAYVYLFELAVALYCDSHATYTVCCKAGFHHPCAAVLYRSTVRYF